MAPLTRLNKLLPTLWDFYSRLYGENGLKIVFFTEIENPAPPPLPEAQDAETLVSGDVTSPPRLPPEDVL